MSDNKKTQAADKKTRRSGINRVDTVIRTPADAGKFVTDIRSKLKGEDTATNTYNNHGFTNLSIDEIEVQGVVNMITLAADSLARRNPEALQLVSQIVADTSRRLTRQRLSDDYSAVAKRLGIDTDTFARQQKHAKTGKAFTNFNELLDHSVNAEMAGSVS